MLIAWYTTSCHSFNRIAASCSSDSVGDIDTGDIIALQNLHREIEAHYFVVKPAQGEQRVIYADVGVYMIHTCVLAWRCMKFGSL